MFISIIIPFYNIGEKIKKAVTSCLRQKDKDKFEIVFVDDGSTDHSVNYINNFKGLNKLNYTIISQKNKGVSVARNNGLNVAKGDYILFLDSDDYIHEDLINDLTKNIHQQPDLIYWGYDTVDEEGNTLQKYNDTNTYCDEREKLLHQYLSGKTWIWTGSVLYKKSFLKENQIRYTEGKVFSEDIEFITKCIIYSKKIVCLHRTYSYYVQNPASITKGINYKRFQSIHTLAVIENLLKGKKEFDVFIKIFKPKYYWACITNLIYYGMSKNILKKVSKNKNIRKQIKLYQTQSKAERVKKYLFLYFPIILYKLQTKRSKT
jgi:glycosyltransferase involved in cell wall biosynthesis